MMMGRLRSTVLRTVISALASPSLEERVPFTPSLLMGPLAVPRKAKLSPGAKLSRPSLTSGAQL